MSAAKVTGTRTSTSYTITPMDFSPVFPHDDDGEHDLGPPVPARPTDDHREGRSGRAAEGSAPGLDRLTPAPTRRSGRKTPTCRAGSRSRKGWKLLDDRLGIEVTIENPGRVAHRHAEGLEPAADRTTIRGV